jgi:hypothetical protein
MLFVGTFGVRVHFTNQRKYWLFGPQRFEVVIGISFSEIEEEFIVTHELQRFVVVERMPTIFRDLYGEWCETDNNVYLGKFLTDTHVEPVVSLRRAKLFERQFLSALQPVKSHFSQWMPPDVSQPRPCAIWPASQPVTTASGYGLT